MIEKFIILEKVIKVKVINKSHKSRDFDFINKSLTFKQPWQEGLRLPTCPKDTRTMFNNNLTNILKNLK